MALADTAKLVASLELQDKFSRNADRFNAAVGGMEQRVGTLGRIGSEVGRGLGQASANLQRLAVVGVGVIGANVAAGIQTLLRLEEVNAATNAVIESTGGVAGVTAEQVRNLAEKYEGLNATIDDKVIQSAENLLLTFPAITEKAFEPALEAALNLNQALGGGEEGLQGTLLQVGKALQDPTRGLTALRRSGVSFTKAQQDQIKALVEANDLYGAQTIILAELSRQFGGQFAAAGDTGAARVAKFKDAIEDAQAALATAFLPLLGKVADKLTTFLADPATLAAIESFGGDLAGAFDKILEIGGQLPWDQIANAFTIVGTGSKALLDAFLGLPPWVQTAVLTGWGLNKLTGGALTGIIGTIAGSLFSRGASPANPMWVQSVGGGVGGAGGAAAAGGAAGVISSFLGVATAVGLGAVIGTAVGRELIAPTLQPAVDLETSRFEQLLQGGDRGAQQRALDAINEGIGDIHNLGIAQFAFLPELQLLETQRDQLANLLGDNQTLIRDADQTVQFLNNLNQQAGRQIDLQRGHTAGIAGLDATIRSRPDPVVNVSVVSSVSISDVQRRIVSQQIAIGRGVQADAP